MTTTTFTTRLLQLPPLWVAVVVSAVLSLISVLQNPILNDDAYGYLRAAELFSTGSAAEVFEQYGWYSYSLLIALLNPVVPGGLVASAHLLNAVLMAALVAAFISVCRELQPGPRIPWLAALTILVFPMLNEMRYMLIRDFGFLAFSLWSLFLLLRFQASGRWQYALAWCVALSLAAAFRLEALLLLALAPLSLLRQPRQTVVLYAVVIACAAAFTVVSTMLQVNVLDLMQFAYRYYLPQLIALSDVLTTNANALGNSLFTTENFPGSNNTAHSMVILLFAYSYSALINLSEALSVPVSLLLLYAGWRGWLRLAIRGRAPLLIYMACSALALLLFISIMHFLTQRYAALLSILLLLLVPGVLNRWYDLVPVPQQRRFRLISGCFVVYFVIDSLVSFGHSRDYVEEAAAWIQTELPADKTLHTNSYFLAYESGRIEHYDKVAVPVAQTLAESTPMSSLAIALRAHDATVLAALEADQRLALVKSFSNSRGDEVRIYDVR